MMTKIKEFYGSYISDLEKSDSALSSWEWSKILEIQKTPCHCRISILYRRETVSVRQNFLFDFCFLLVLILLFIFPLTDIINIRTLPTCKVLSAETSNLSLYGKPRIHEILNLKSKFKHNLQPQDWEQSRTLTSLSLLILFAHIFCSECFCLHWGTLLFIAGERLLEMYHSKWYLKYSSGRHFHFCFCRQLQKYKGQDTFILIYLSTR